MKHIGHRRAGVTTDATGWLLGTIIAVLAVLDLLIWTTLWNVPNPVSKLLLPQASVSRLPAAPAPFGDIAPRPASLIAVPAAPAAAFEQL